VTAGAGTGDGVRAVIAAAVVAGVPAGLLYAAAAYGIALPVLLEAEVFETGLHAAHDAHALYVSAGAAGAGRLWWGLAGAVGLGCALALVLTPLVRAAGHGRPPGWRAGAVVGALAFLTVFLLPMLVTRPGPPGVESTAALGTRQGAWVLSLLLFAAAWWIGTWVRARLTRSRRGTGAAALGGAAVGIAAWALGMGLYLGLTGYAPGAAPGPVPDAVAHRFGAAMVLANALLCAALGALIPPALRRFAP